MEQKNKITTLRELFKWIEENSRCSVRENEKDFFRIATCLNTDVFVDIEAGDNMNDIIYKTVTTLNDFDADDRFTELWDVDFSKRTGFSPSQFVKMLQEDKETFQELADKLVMLKQDNY